MYKCLLVMGYEHFDLSPVAQESDRYVYLEPIDYTKTALVKERVEEILELSETKVGILTKFNERIYSRLVDRMDILLVYPIKDKQYQYLCKFEEEGMTKEQIKKISINWNRDLKVFEDKECLKRTMHYTESILDVIRF